MTGKSICVLGGTGFVGGHLVSRLANDGHAVKILTRRRERHRRFLVMPNVQLKETANLEAETLAAELAGSDAVINLIGILQGDHTSFTEVHADLPARIVAACKSAGIRRYLHMSALNADAENGPSAYLRSKGAGEEAAAAGAQHDVAVTRMRPSVIFGAGDGLFSRFAALLKISPVLPLACPNARFAPVYVGDVVEAFRVALNDPATAGQSYELCGPRIYTLKELVDYTAQLIGAKYRIVWGLSDGLSRRQAAVFDWLFRYLPGDPPFSSDNLRSMQLDSVCSADGLAALGISARSVDSVMPRLFEGGSGRADYSRFRSVGRR